MERSKKLSKTTSDRDRISALPDCILFHILSKLPTLKDLVKTTILSKRWLSLGQWALKKDLSFDLHNMFESNELEEFNSFCRSYSNFKTENLQPFAQIQSEFVRRVDQFMQHYEGTKVDSLRIDFLLCHKHNDIVDKWIRYVIDKGLERIELLLSKSFVHRTLPGQSPSYKFPHKLLCESDFSNCIKYLHLQNCILMPPAEFYGFNNLTTLWLDDVDMTDALISCLFSKCVHLEDLCFIRCRFSDYGLNIISPTLHHLKLIDCRHGMIDVVTLKLSSFEYGGDMCMISSINAPQLLKLYLRPADFLDESAVPSAFALIAKFLQLENVTMCLQEDHMAWLPSTFGPFQNLKQLELILPGPDLDGNNELKLILSGVDLDEEDEDLDGEDEDYLWVLNIVMASPHLQKLSLTFLESSFFANQRQRREHPGFSHDELKYVELCGCVGNMFEIELASHFLKDVNSLEQITFSPCSKYYKGAGQWSNGFDNPDWFRMGRNLVREMIQDKVNERTKLIFL